jgi:ubiquitin thioesterase protein OTUB1
LFLADEDDLCLYMVYNDEFGWRKEISSSAFSEDDDNYAVALSSLDHGVVVEIRTRKDSVGPRMELNLLASDFRHNKSMVEKVAQLGVGYMGYRKVRGDGNCYYRAVIFGLLENIIESGSR